MLIQDLSLDETAATGAPPAAAWDAAALRAYCGAGGLRVAHVGDLTRATRPSSRVNTSPAFCAALAADFERVETVELPNWAPVMHGALTVWRRMQGTGSTLTIS